MNYGMKQRKQLEMTAHHIQQMTPTNIFLLLFFIFTDTENILNNQGDKSSGLMLRINFRAKFIFGLLSIIQHKYGFSVILSQTHDILLS